MGTIFYLCYQIVSVSTPDTELASYTPVEMKEGIVFDQIWLHKEDLYMVVGGGRGFAHYIMEISQLTLLKDRI